MTAKEEYVIIWLSLPREILGNMCIAFLTRLLHVNFEINLIFLIKPFFYKTWKSRKKLKYLENEKSF